MRKPGRALVVLVAVAAATACGLSMSGTSELSPPRDAGEDVIAPPFPSPDAGGWDGGYPDASYDANDGAAAACLAICPDAGGSCDGGTCVFTCANGACKGTRTVVRCPAAVPCAVDCLEGDECDEAIDCSAAGACNVRCLARNTCKKRVTCSGASCAVECSSASTCAMGVVCDAGSCDLRCTGNNSCNNDGPNSVACAGSSCAITCGGKGGACNGDVVCDAGASCSIQCLDKEACNKVTARARVVTVSCDGTDSCVGGVFVSAGDASVGCTGGGSAGTCFGGVHCDGGKCTQTCASTLPTLKFCCQSETCVDAGACSVTDAGCPL